MGNYISIIIGCVGAIEFITFFHQITLRADIEHEQELLRQSGQESSQLIISPLSEPRESAINDRESANNDRENTINESENVFESNSTITNECPNLSDQTAPVVEDIIGKTTNVFQYNPPEIRFEEYERSQSIPDIGVLPVVDGVKFRPLVRDDGTGRRKTVKKRNSSGSIDSKLSREEELRMFTSLEEEEFSSLSEDYVPISYSSNSDSVVRTKRHQRRHKKSPTIEPKTSEDSSSSREVLKEVPDNEDSEVTYPWGDIKPVHHKNLKLWEREKAMSIEELLEDDDKTKNDDASTFANNVNDDSKRENDNESVSKNRIFVSIESEPAVTKSFACETQNDDDPNDEKLENIEVEEEKEIEEEDNKQFLNLTEAHLEDESVMETTPERKVEEWLMHGLTEFSDPSNDPSDKSLNSPEDEQNDEEEDMAFYIESEHEVQSDPEIIHIIPVDEVETEVGSYLNLENFDKTILQEIIQKNDVKAETRNFLEVETGATERKVSIASEVTQISECLSTIRYVTPESESSNGNEESFVLVEEPEIGNPDEEEDEIRDFSDIIVALNREVSKDNSPKISFPTEAPSIPGQFPKEISDLLIPDDYTETKHTKMLNRQDSIQKKIRKQNTNVVKETGHHPRYNMPLHSVDMSIRLELSNRHFRKELKFFPLKKNNKNIAGFPTYKTVELDLSDSENSALEEHPPVMAKTKKRLMFDGPKLDLAVIDEEGHKAKTTVEKEVMKTSSATPGTARSRSPSPFIADRNDPMMVLLHDSMSIP